MDKAILEEAISEAAGGDEEIAGLLRKKFETNADLAAKFVAPRMRNADYTKKTTELANQKKQFDTVVTQYEQRLEQAEKDKKDILTRLSEQEISTATAQALLNRVKTEYALGDDDIPGMADLIKTRKTGEVPKGAGDIDIDAKLADFEKGFMDRISKTLIPELTGMSELDLVWDDIRSEHQELTGKRLSIGEQRELLSEARKQGVSIKSLWENKFSVPDLRERTKETAMEARIRQKIADEDKERRSKAALDSVTESDAPLSERGSPILKKRFSLKSEEDQTGTGIPKQTKSAAEREATSGAQRAAKKFIEKGGVASMGKPWNPPSSKTA